MPKYASNSDVFAGFAPTGRFHSDLPASDMTRTDALARLQQRVGLVNNYLTNFGDLARLSTGRIAIAQGIPDFRATSLPEIFIQWPIAEARGDIASLATSKVVRGAAQVWNKAMREVATDIPVLGWVASVGYFVADLVLMLVGHYKTEEPKNVVQALIYNKERDEQQVNDILKDVGAAASGRLPDWTPYFMPVDTNPSWRLENIAWSSHGRPEGFRLTTGWSAEAASGWGLLPGVTDRVGDYQWPSNLPGSNRPSHPQLIETWAPIFPSTLQWGLTAWEMAMKPSIQMFQINASEIDIAWTDWFWGLRDFARTQDEHTRGMLEYASNWLNRVWVGDRMVDGKQEQIYRWVSKYPRFAPAGRAAGGVVRLPSKYSKPGMEYLLAWKADLLRQRQFEALRTLLVAYVPPTAAALRNDTAMADRHVEMRKRLLTHQARHQVELDLIPDTEYRLSMALAQQKVGDSFTTYGWPKMEGVPGIDDQPFPDVPNPGPGIEGEVGPRRPKGLSTGTKVALAGGAALAFWQREAIANFFRRGR